MSGVLLFIWRREACGDPDAAHSEHPFEGIELHSYHKDQKSAETAITLAEAKWRAEHDGAWPEWKWLIEDVAKEMLADPKADREPDVEPEAVEVTSEPAAVCEYNATHMMAGVPATTTIDCGPVGIVPACQLCADFYKNH